MVPARLTRDEGFSVSEMMVVSLLLGIVLAASYLLMSAATGMADQIQARTIAADEGRAVMDRITREVRQAYEIEDNKGAFVDAQPRQCTFYTDADRDGRPEMVRYRVVGQVLYRSQASATSALPPYTFGPFSAEEVIVSSLSGGFNGNVFEYYDSADPPRVVPSGKPADVSAVRLRLVTSATVNKKTAFVDLSTWVKVRAVHNTID
jgi:prepilin-type N-terminal cleavage/methylation domain-containing protein